MPYFDVRCRFDDARARALLERAGVERPDPSDYLGRLIAYAQQDQLGQAPDLAAGRAGRPRNRVGDAATVAAGADST